MASSRKSRNLSNSGPVAAAFERALGEIRARVSVCAADRSAVTVGRPGTVAGALDLPGHSAVPLPVTGSGISPGHDRDRRQGHVHVVADGNGDGNDDAHDDAQDDGGAVSRHVVNVDIVARPFAIGVGFSGGLDSTVLLVLAAEYGRRHGVRVEALHVHHGLSPHADAWSAHCERICRALNVELHVARVSVASDGQGVEAAARNARYAALGQACAERRLPLLLCAHHQDDQAETLLLQLLRGAGVAGLSGMAAGERRPGLLGADVFLGRPLLGVGRADLEAFATQRQLQWVTDESNQDIRYRRNALRHRVLPILRQAFPGYAPVIARSAAHMQSAQALLDDLARIDLAACIGQGNDRLQLLPLRQLSDNRVDNLLRYWLSQLGLRRPSNAQLQQLRHQMLEAAPDQHPVFPLGSVELRRTTRELQLVARTEAGSPQALRLSWRGEAVIDVPSWRGRLVFGHGSGPAVPASLLRTATISLQPRQGNERLKLASNRPSRSLKNLFQEAGIPAWTRPWLPLIFADDRLLAVGAIGTDCRMLASGPGVTLQWQPDQTFRSDV